MSKARVAVLKVVTKELTVTAAAAKYGYSRRHLHRLLTRYHQGGLEAVEPRSRRPHSNPTATPEPVRDRIIALRLQLTAQGLDAGPVTLAWHLEREGHRPPSTSTIRRILNTADLVTPEPRKRPRSSYHRFAAAQPNECWQSDFTHWRLADGTDVEILNWLDDHARYLLGCTAHTPVTGDIVAKDFLTIADEHGFPSSTLTDNGRVYTARFGGGKNAFEYLLTILGITQKNGHPGHPRPRARSNDSTRPSRSGSPNSHQPRPWPTSKSSSTPGARSTTSSDPTANSAGEHPTTPTSRSPKQHPPDPEAPATTGCATTASTNSER
jgi:transposase InsO family protein